MPEYRSEHRCEAKIAHKPLKQGIYPAYSLEGRRIDLPKGVSETPSVEEVTIACTRCNIHHVLTAEGFGFAAYNEGDRQAKAFLRENCGKWQERVANGYDKGSIPDGMIPR